MRLTLLKQILLVVLSGVILASCVDTRKATYFNGMTDGTITKETPVPESIIRPNDILSITVSSLNTQATELYNQPNNAMPMAGGGVSGYLVTHEGTIQFPQLGSLKAAGMTKGQLKELIQKKLSEKELLKDPIVTIRFLNFRVTILGEVKNPTVLTIPNEKISLLEAIGLAGDLTIYGKRDNVLIIREENGQKIIKRIDLNKDELLSSPYYYLKSDDVVYVEPTKSRVASANNNTQWIGVAVSILSFGVIVVDRLVK